MTVIGLGQAGCNIAEMFEEHPDYQVKLIDSDIEGPNCFSVPKYSNPEECEQNFPDISSFLKDCKNNVVLFVGGGGNISAAALKVIFPIRDKKVHVMYIKPEALLIGETGQMHEKVVSNVLQEYARSGMLAGITLIDNLCIEEINGDVPVISHFKEINKTIFQTIYGLEEAAKFPAVIDNYSHPKSISCIKTYGTYLYQHDEEKLFYNLNNIDSKCYYFFINKEQLATDGKLFKEIKNSMKKKAVDNVKISYIIYATSSEQNYCLLTATSSQIQN